MPEYLGILLLTAFLLSSTSTLEAQFGSLSSFFYLTNTDCEDSEYRSIDGHCNNLGNLTREDWGAAGIPLFRRIAPAYGEDDHKRAMGGDTRLSPRTISNAMCSQSDKTLSAQGLSSFVFTWGQFLDHDISLTPVGSEESAPILLPEDEPLFVQPISFFRSEPYSAFSQNSYRQQTNLITSFIDGSNVYGSDDERAEWLRTFEDGKLKLSKGGLLPFNTIDGEFESEIDPLAPHMDGDNGGLTKTFVAGDVRAAEQPGLTSLHTLFVRHHNLVCDRLIAEGITDDEEIYQKARKEIGGILQAITYNEFLPALGVRLNSHSGYRSYVQPDISNLFATAAYRLGHTMVTDRLLLKEDKCSSLDREFLNLLEAFFNPSVTMTYNIHPILSGLATQTQNEIDTKIVDDLRNFLFGDPTSPFAVGLDLASLNIQRGRDHGLPDFNTVQRYFTGRSARDFSDITADPETAEHLKEMYGDVNNIDLWVGLLSEDKRTGSPLPPTLNKIMEEQFQRLRDGDRYFYLNDKYLDDKDKERIRNTKLSDIILLNTPISDIQENVFFADACQEEVVAEGRSDNRSEVIETKVYPNPVLDRLFIEISGISQSEEAELVIVDMLGRSRNSFTFSDIRNSVDVSSLPGGTYQLIIATSQSREVIPFVKIEG